MLLKDFSLYFWNIGVDVDNSVAEFFDVIG